MISQSELKRLLHYDPATGIFTWNISGKGIKEKGSIAGTIGKKGYIIIGIERKRYYAHRLAFLYMTGKWPDQADHINHIKDDNRWCNLRSVSNLQNHQNKPVSRRNKSGICGVSFYKRKGKFAAEIKVKGQKKFLGYFDDLSAAARARKSAERRYGFHPNHGTQE